MARGSSPPRHERDDDMLLRMTDNATRRPARAATTLMATLLAAGASAGCDPDRGEAVTSGLTQLDSNVPADYVRHASRSVEGARVTLKAPPGWKATRTSGNVALNLATDRPGSSVNVVIVPATTGETLDKAMAQLPRQLRGEFANFDHVASDYLVFNDTPAGRIVYEAARAGFHGKLMQILVFKGGKNYILTFTALPEEYEAQVSAVERVLASMTIRQ